LTNSSSSLRPLLDREARILDVGCNDGRFLRHLLVDGWQNITGLEPTRNTSEEAMRQGLTVHQQSLDYEVGSNQNNALLRGELNAALTG
jgi:2-polyprenyl-3-methyl-5-hydroxy-6-metoxy-1,4-benzoquinol methylase